MNDFLPLPRKKMKSYSSSNDSSMYEERINEGKEREMKMGLCWSSSWRLMKRLSPYFCMVFAQFAFSSYAVVSKIIFIQGANPFVFNFYLFTIATTFLALLAFFFERKTRPPLTLPVIGWSFLLGLLGVTLYQNLFVASLTYISTTSTTSISNLFPAITYILSVISRQEKPELNTLRGFGKLFGTLVSILGTFALIFWRTDHVRSTDSGTLNMSIGYGFAVIGIVSLSLWLVLLCRVTMMYPSELTITALLYFFGTIQTFLVAVAMTRDKGWSEWKIDSTLELQNLVSGGVLNCAVGNLIFAWCSRKKGPLFVAVFTPLALLFTALLETIFLHTTMDIGCTVGSVMIVGGLYIFLWSKSKENFSDESKSVDDNEDQHKGITSPLLLNHQIP